MANKAKKATAKATGSSALARRYGSIAEIKREFFPNAAAEDEAEAAARSADSVYEDLMDELLQPREQAPA